MKTKDWLRLIRRSMQLAMDSGRHLHQVDGWTLSRDGQTCGCEVTLAWDDDGQTLEISLVSLMGTELGRMDLDAVRPHKAAKDLAAGWGQFSLTLGSRSLRPIGMD